MPTLIVNLPGHARGLVLRDRALIGRRPFNSIMVADPTVSRIHAWVGRREGRYVLFDAGSRAGTRVNGQAVTAPRVLADRDEIGVGPAMIEYRDADELPGHVEPIDASPPSPVADPYDGGIYFDCTCGGPMWVGAEYAGAAGKCRYCGKRLIVPHRSGKTARPPTPSGELSNVVPRREPPAVLPDPAKAAPPAHAPREGGAAAEAPRIPAPKPVERPAPPPPAAPEPVGVPAAVEPIPPAISEPEPVPQPEPELPLCSICQTAIGPGEEKTTCPSCGLELHAPCWRENYGCSAYGCDQVNVLAPPEERKTAAEEPLQGEVAYGGAYPGEVADDLPAFPWESVLLALSFVAMFLSALGFGVPSAAMLLAGLVFLVVGRAQRKSLVFVAMLVSVAGTVAGYGMSMFWWRGVRVWEAFLR
jgi:hypothetical protein